MKRSTLIRRNMNLDFRDPDYNDDLTDEDLESAREEECQSAIDRLEEEGY